MSKEFTIMKTALFGGFKKSDVLSYIEQLQTETADIKSMLDAKREEEIELKRKIDELEIRLYSLSTVNEKLIEKEKEANDLALKLELALKENQKFSETITEYDEKSEKLRRAEKQIGAAYIDARRYTDDLVDTARAKAKDIGAVASQDVKTQANEIEELLKDVDTISKKFNSSLEQLHKDVYALSTKLNSSASSLLNLHTDLTGIEAHTFEYESDFSDDNSFTVISYSENTDNFDSDVKEG